MKNFGFSFKTRKITFINDGFKRNIWKTVYVHYRLETEAIKIEEISKNVNLLKSHRRYTGIGV